LLEPVREFVVAHVPGVELDGLRARQRAWLLAWAGGLQAGARPAQVALELPAVHAVLAAADAPQDALRLAMALRSYWEADGLPERVLDALEAALQALPADHALRADAHELLAHLHMSAGRADVAMQHADAAVEAAGSDPARRARALVRRVWGDIAFGHIDQRESSAFRSACADLDEALALACGAADRETQARTLQVQAVLWCNVHLSSADADLARAEALFAQSEALWLALGDRRQALARQRNRAQCWVALGRREAARATFERGEQAARDDGDWVGQMDNQISLCGLLCDQRQWEAAVAAARRCIALSSSRWHLHGLAYGLWNIARPLARLRRPQAALQLLAFAVRFWTEGMGPLRADDQRYVRRVRALVQAQLGKAQSEVHWAQGSLLDLRAAVQLALGG